MDFFEAQEGARRRSRVLYTLFSVAVLALVAATNALALAVRAASLEVPFGAAFDPGFCVTVSLCTLFVVGLGSLYKIGTLSDGGRAVAELLGGRPIPPDTDDPRERRLLNVVAEMAIAAGTPVPEVYLLKREPGINAFAAGRTPYDAVIGVTAGTLRELDRDRIQGVIAHEFSHIVNGDMRINLNLMGLVHGIMLLGLTGQYLLRSLHFVRVGGRGRSGGAGALGLIGGVGLGLMVLGYLGTFFGNLIKAAVNRQREFLADAAAVQYTRNPEGITGALKRIGGIPNGPRLLNPHSAQASHAFFGAGDAPILGFLLSTHPPLEARIRRLEPNWDGAFDTRPVTPETAPREQLAGEQTLGRTLEIGSGRPRQAIDGLAALALAGTPSSAHLEMARRILGAIPAPLRTQASDPYGARALLYALVAAPDDEARERQFAHLDREADTGVAPLTRTLFPATTALDPALRLPLIELTLPAVHALSSEQLTRFRGNLKTLLQLGGELPWLSWAVTRVVLAQIDGVAKPPRDGHATPIHQLTGACSVVLSAASYANGDRDQAAQDDFDAGQHHLQLPAAKLVPVEVATPAAVEAALKQLAHLGPLHKRRLLRALVACIHADGSVNAEEAEFVRAIAEVLGCPIPPILADGPGGAA